MNVIKKKKYVIFKVLIAILALFVVNNIKVYAESSDATLKSLSVTNHEFKRNFNKNVLEYDLYLDLDETSIEINAEENEEHATLVYNHNVSVTQNPQTESVLVTAEDGTVKTYVINIQKVTKAYLITGPQFNSKLKGMTNQYTNIYREIRRATDDEYNNYQQQLTSNNIISTNDSPYPVYLWYTGGNVILYYSEADVIYMNPNSSNMFNELYMVNKINIPDLDSSNVTNMAYMFSNDDTSTTKITDFNTSNVTNMNHMLHYARGYPSDRLNWDTHNVTDMSYMFAGSNSTSVDVSGLDTSNVTNMAYMLSFNEYAKSFPGLGDFDTSKVTNMSHMFDNDLAFAPTTLSLNTSSVTDMSYMFRNCKKLVNFNLSNFDTSQVTNMASMFSGDIELKSLNLSSFNTENVTSMNSMFNGDYKLTELDLSAFDTHNVTDMLGMFAGDTALKTIYVSPTKWSTQSVTTSTGMFRSNTKLVGQKNTAYDAEHTDATYAILDDAPDHPGYLTDKNYEGTYFTVTFANGSVASYLFGSEISLGKNNVVKDGEVIGQVTLKYNNGTNDQVYDLYKIYSVNGWLVNNVHYDNNATIRVNENKYIQYDYSSFNGGFYLPPNVENGDATFLGWYTEETGGEQITSPEQLSEGNTTLYARYLFNESVLVDGNVFYPKVVDSNYTGTFRKATLEEYNLVKDTLTNDNIISIADTIPTYMWVSGHDVLYYSEASKIYMNPNSYNMFREAKFNRIDLSEFDTSRVTSTSGMFYETEAEEIDLTGWDTHNVTDMSFMFLKATKVKELDLSSFDTSNVTNMQTMFGSVESLKELDLSNFDTHNVTNMDLMFYLMYSLEKLNVKSFDTSNVTTMRRMFQAERKMKTLDISNFDTSSVTDMREMFEYMDEIETIYVGDLWDTSSVTSGNGTEMFINDTKLVGQEGTQYKNSMSDVTYAHVDGGETNPGYLTYRGYMPKVYFPNGRFIEVEKNSEYTLPTTYNKASENVALVTFNYNAENKDDDYGYVTRQYTLNKWNIDDTEYDPGDTITVITDIHLVPEYVDYLEGVEFPSNPQYAYSDFAGWYTDPDNGELVELYNSTDPITLYAHWTNEAAVLMQGQPFNWKIHDSFNTTGVFRYATLEEYNAVKDSFTDVNIISDDSSPVPVYMWQDGNDVLYYSEAPKIYMNQSTQWMFESTEFTDIDLSHFDSSRVVDMGGLFKYCHNLTTIELSNFDTSNVTNMVDLFQGSENIVSLDLSNFDTSKVRQFSGMFDGCRSLTDLDISSFDTSNATSLEMMFRECASLPSIDVTHFDTSRVVNMGSIFQGCEKVEELDLSSFDTHNVENCSMLFTYDYKLTTIYVDSVKWDLTDANRNSNYDMFLSNYDLIGQNGTEYTDEESHDKEYAIIDNAPSNPGYLTDVANKGITHSVTYPDGTIEIKNHNSVVRLSDNETTQPNEDLATVTFVYHDDETDNTTDTVKLTHPGNGYLVNGDTWYDNTNPRNKIRINEDKVITYSYDNEVVSPTMPEPTRDGYIFDGWWTAENGGELVENYTVDQDLTLHAHWLSENITIVLSNNEEIEVPRGEYYELPLNDILKDNYKTGDVTFDPNNGENPFTRELIESYVVNGWTINGIHYDSETGIIAGGEVHHHAFNPGGGEEIGGFEDPGLISPGLGGGEEDPGFSGNSTPVVDLDRIVLVPDYVTTVIPIDWPDDPVNGDKVFGGWYDMYGNLYTNYTGSNDIYLTAKWFNDPVNLTIDGNTTMVERGYIYTIPDSSYESSLPEKKITIHLDYGDEENTYKDVDITYGYGIDYQLINNKKYYPYETYIVNEDTTIYSIRNWDNKVAMNPYITEPTRDGFVFMGWQLLNWEYYDTSDINVDIYSLTPEDIWFDNQTFYAEWQEYDPDTQVVVRFIDEFKNQDYSKIYEKGTEFTFEDLGETNTFDINVYSNINDAVSTITYTTESPISDYYVNDSNYYYVGDTYTLNENTTIKINRGTYSYYECDGDLCDVLTYSDGYRYNNYIYRGLYTNSNYEGYPLDSIYNIEVNNTYYGSHYAYGDLYAKFEGSNNVILSVDNEISIIPKGLGTIPGPTHPYGNEYYTTTFKYQDGVTPTTIDVRTHKYIPVNMDVNGDTYDIGDSYDYEEDTYIWTNYDYEFEYEIPLINDEHFLGWFDDPINGNEVTSLDDMWQDVTLYGHWDYPPVNVTFEGYTDEVPYGFTYDLAEFKNMTNYQDGATITFHDASGNYDNDTWTLTNTVVPIKVKMNGVEYDLEGDYSFIVDTEMELVYEEQPQEEELPTENSMYYEHYTFGGWYDNENYEGEPLTTYKGTENIDLYAKWIGEEVTVTINDDENNVLVYHYGDTFIFPDLPETYVIDAGNVVFDFNDGVTPDSVQHLTVTLSPKYWFYEGYDENGDQHYAGANPDETVVLYGNSYIYAESDDDNDYVYSGVTIPEVPGMEHYSFDGWYNEWDNEITAIEQLEGYDQVIMARYTGEDVIVHLPDEDVTVEYGKVYDIFENNYPTADTIEATVTFKYHAENADDYQAYVTKQYTPSGWLINGVHYNSDTIIFTEETTLVPDYSETVIPVEFPEDPVWFRHDFDGWFTEETGGEQVTSYSDLTDVTLHAHWHDHMAVITTPDGDVTVDENKQFTFPTNDIAKANQYIGKVTFDPQNGEPLIQQNIIKLFTPNGWLLDGVHYDDNETITVLDDSTITPDYIETINVEFPSDPVKPHYTFKGWYNAMNGGDKVLSTDMKTPMTVYAHYFETNTEGEEYKLPSNQPVKPTEILATVTFDPHNGDPVTTSTVTKKWLAKGWLVDGELHYNGDIIYKTPDTVIEPNYTYVIVSAEFPIAPTRGTERYTGWFTQETGGEQVKNYEGTEDITLHAHYTDNYALLKDGETVNYAFCQVSGNTSCNSMSVPNFEEGTYEQYQAKADSAMVISTDDSPYPVYIWMERPYWYYYTEAETIYFNEDSSHFFSNYFGSVRNINIDKFNSSYVTDFSYFFYHTGYYNRQVVLPLDKLDTSNATNVQYMIGSTGASSLDLSSLNTARVVNFSYFLYNNENITSLDVSHINTSSARDMHGMFSNTKITSIDVSHFDTSNATDISRMFSYCTELTSLDLSNFDTSNVTDLSAFIISTTKLTSINLSSFDTSNVTDMTQFMKGSGLREIDLSSFDTTNVTSIYEMFNECPKLEKIWVSEDKWINSNLTPNQGGLRTFYEVPNLIGQRGTAYANTTSYHASYNQDGKYAYNRVDKAPEKPGYLWNKYATKYIVTLPDDTEEIYEGAPYTIPTNTYPVDVEVLNTITFDPLNGEETVTSSTIKTKLPVGFKIDDVSYATGDTYTVNSDITLVPDYTEEIVYATFPDDPIKDNSEFAGWYTTETAGDKVEDLTTITEDKTLYARYETTLPTDFTIDTDNVLLVVSDTHVIEVTFDPIETSDNITYTGYDDEIISVSDTGIITGLSKGTTTITVGLENVDVTKTIEVTVISNLLESDVYEVRSIENKPKIIIGADPLTTIQEFKDSLTNPNEYIKIYDENDNLLSDDDIVKTGLIIKLEYENRVLDEASMVVRGDVDGDGYVNISDYIMVSNHALGIEEITDYVAYTAADVEEDEVLNIADYIIIMDYGLGNSDNLNN